MSKEKDSKGCIDGERRRFLMLTTGIVGGIGAICALKPLVSALMPNAKTLASGVVEVDLSLLQPGEQITVSWRGKPVWIIRRTKEMLKKLVLVNDNLRDPLSLVPQQPAYAKNVYRSINPEYLVLVGLCTHLGCSPKYTPNEKTGFFCPCHGSTFDLAGRVYKDVPAPINLEVPPYYFKSAKCIVIGGEEHA